MGSGILVIIDNSKPDGDPKKVIKAATPQELWDAIWGGVYENGLVGIEAYEDE